MVAQSRRSKEQASQVDVGEAVHGNASSTAGNQARASQVARKGPSGDPQIDAALAACFGDGIYGLNAVFGQAAANAALGADAHASGKNMSFGAGIAPRVNDPGSLEVIAHEVAHALAPKGQGKGVDLEGDRGEDGADAAGRTFRAWAERGFDGDAPHLRPASGGAAEIQRFPTAPTTLTGSPTLQRGSRGGQVATLQTLLGRAGFAVAVDGDFGVGTHRAVRRFQAANRLPADGVVGPKTAAALNRHATATPAPAGGGESVSGGSLDRYLPLRQGSAGAGVRILQLLLNQKGARIVVDQEFGPMTANAVRGFQLANRLEVDGIVGRNTAAALQRADSKPVSSGGTGGTGGVGGVGGGPEPKDVSEWRDKVLEGAQKHLGKLYYWGGDGPSNFDCSGFALYVLRQETGLVTWGDDTAGGIKGRLPRTENPKKGDMVFFSNGGSIEHVEIVAGSGSSTIGASGGGSRTRGDNPNAKVKWGNWNNDRRGKSFGSIQGLIEAKIARAKKK